VPECVDAATGEVAAGGADVGVEDGVAAENVVCCLELAQIYFHQVFVRVVLPPIL
jgi:hypothetical protein